MTRQPQSYQVQDDAKAKKVRYGLIGLFLSLPILMIGGVLFIFAIFYFSITSMAEFKCATAQLNKNEKAVELLGDNIENGYLIMPNIETNGARRDVQFSVSVSGSKSSGKMTVISFRDTFRSDYAVFLEAGGKDFTIYTGVFPCE